MIERRSKRELQGADLTPMIDVVFLLLVFFMVATNFVEETQQYDIELPQAEEAEIVKNENTLSIIVQKFDSDAKLEDRKTFWVQTQVVEHKQLFKEIEKHMKAMPDKPTATVVIKADKEARYQDIISVISCLRAQDISNFSLAVLSR